MYRTLTPAIATGLLAGCVVSTKPLPYGWGDAVALVGGTCDWVNGTFYDEGESDNKHKPSLARLLGANEPGKDSPKVLKLSYSTGTPFKIEGDATSSALFRSFQPSDYACVDGSLSLSRTVGTNREGVAGYERFTHFIYESNGHLVVKTSSSAVGVMLLIPVAASQTYYYRFRRASR